MRRFSSAAKSRRIPRDYPCVIGTCETEESSANIMRDSVIHESTSSSRADQVPPRSQQDTRRLVVTNALLAQRIDDLVLSRCPHTCAHAWCFPNGNVASSCWQAK
jgi:hypothetical protein